jgi:hypothetical protein
MKIIVDKEGESIIKQFSDLALRAGGLQNLTMVQVVLQSMKVEVDEKKKVNLNEVKDVPPAGQIPIPEDKKKD